MEKPGLSGAVPGTPSLGAAEGAVVLNKSFGNVCPTLRHRHGGAAAFPRGFPGSLVFSEKLLQAELVGSSLPWGAREGRGLRFPQSTHTCVGETLVV